MGGGKGERVEPAEGVAGHDVGAGHVGAAEQGVQVGGDRAGVLGSAGILAPPSARAVVDADGRVARHRRGDPAEVGRHLAATGLNDDYRAAGPGAVQVQAVPADVDQPTRHRGRRRVTCRADSLVRTAERGQAHRTDDRVEHPARSRAGQLAVDARGHPERECEQDRRPDPVDRGVGGGPEGQQDHAAGAQHRSRHRRPALRPRGEPRRQSGQCGPADREAAQDRPRECALGGGHHGCSDQAQGGQEPRGHRPDHDHRHGGAATRRR
jgi:hypothetical protein